MRPDTISRATARHYYNHLGTRLDSASRYEARAKASAITQLGAQSSERLLHLGVGTGHDHVRLVQAVAPGGTVVGLDLAREMLTLTRQKTIRPAHTPMIEGDATNLPFADVTFDRLFSAYLLDLLSSADIRPTLREWHRVLRPGGRIVLVSMTEGVDPYSCLFVAFWKARFRISPETFGGCRPLQLGGLIANAGFTDIQRRVIVQNGFPSELIVAERKH
jgi:ubiquinone/menaquinone biosynthesis C-methylase UbiE